MPMRPKKRQIMEARRSENAMLWAPRQQFGHLRKLHVDA